MRFPAGLGAALQRLYCRSCPNLREIPARFTGLQELYCSDCPRLESLPPTLLDLRALDCCLTSVASLPPDLPALRHLDCAGCPRLTRVPPGYKMLHALNLSNCKGITELPASLTRLETLFCAHSQVQLLPPEFAQLEQLYIHHSKAIKLVPASYTRLTFLDCRECTALVSIPAALPVVVSMYAQQSQKVARGSTQRDCNFFLGEGSPWWDQQGVLPAARGVFDETEDNRKYVALLKLQRRQPSEFEAGAAEVAAAALTVAVAETTAAASASVASSIRRRHGRPRSNAVPDPSRKVVQRRNGWQDISLNPGGFDGDFVLYADANAWIFLPCEEPRPKKKIKARN